MFVGRLKKLRHIADEQSNQFESDGFTAFFAMLRRELDDEYFAEIQTHLKTLKFRDGVLISAGLGKGNKGIHYVLRKPSKDERPWIERMFLQKPPDIPFSFIRATKVARRRYQSSRVEGPILLPMRSPSPRSIF